MARVPQTFLGHLQDIINIFTGFSAYDQSIHTLVEEFTEGLGAWFKAFAWNAPEGVNGEMPENMLLH